MFSTINRGLLAKIFQNHPYGQLVLISSASCQCGRVFEWTLIELRFNMEKCLYCHLDIALQDQENMKTVNNNINVSIFDVINSFSL